MGLQLEFIGQQVLQHGADGVRRHGIGRFGDDVEAIGVQPFGASGDSVAFHFESQDDQLAQGVPEDFDLTAGEGR